MKLTLRTKKSDTRGWPGYILGGRMRTSTLGLIVAFFVTAWLYDTYQPPPAPPETAPAGQIVPPGFVPDPEYTWVPRTSVREYPTTTTPRTTTSTPTTTTTTEPPVTTTEPSPTTTTPTTTTQNPFLPTPPTPQTTPTTAPTPEPGPPPVPPIPGF